MTLAYDIVVSAVILIVSIIVNRIALYLFSPGTALYEMGASASGWIDGAAVAAQWYEILALWVPLFGVVVAVAWPLVRAYRRSAVTARAP